MASFKRMVLLESTYYLANAAYECSIDIAYATNRTPNKIERNIFNNNTILKDLLLT